MAHVEVRGQRTGVGSLLPCGAGELNERRLSGLEISSSPKKPFLGPCSES